MKNGKIERGVLNLTDERLKLLAKNLIEYSVELKEGENILIELIGQEIELAKELVKLSYSKGAKPFLWIKHPTLLRTLLLNATEQQIEMIAQNERDLMEKMDAYIGIRSSPNPFELSDVPDEKMNLYQKIWFHKVHGEVRVPKTKWCILRYPNYSMAQQAKMSLEEFEDFYFNVCNLDYSKMSKAMDALVELMQNTDEVRIVAKDTDLRFSIKGMKAVKCDGHMNIPDGEVYTAPVKDSVNGHITYNTPSNYAGFKFENIRFEFKDGKIVKATANNTEKLNNILDTDEGARYIGEFSIGLNPYITKPMEDTLFDEKIAGSIHFTPGSAYEDADNGNRSAVHWDIVLIQTPEYGGGEIYFDGKLIRKDGRFVIKELEGLNPENLK
ncbi:peptidase M29 aminopeptidase II [Caldicellulosiruptor obsidiansis OB47]|uniref:Peptidase M29 aminopeptidase II n=1 Tax=Caldicellulosiruptor obsidiansis (strain ATCC BAA-2073 / JCM 16842 / OB47) TaxID=608506 RepID=D9TJX9_CALOO|nr:peptidase M29 aminopeptidase II [Caldicellulosiruptor obsidiansis OB47]